MKKDIVAYNKALAKEEGKICRMLMQIIEDNLNADERKIWHRHPVWFINGNPIVGYSKLKTGIKLMFWSGADFEEKGLKPGTGKFKDASTTYTSAAQIIEKDLKRYLKKAKAIQWNYRDIVKNKGKLTPMPKGK